MTKMDRRGLLGSALAVGAAAWLTAGCASGDRNARGGSGAGSEGSEVTIRLPGTPVNFPSPFSYGGGTGYLQASYTYDTLLWKDARGRYIPWLATGFRRTEDGLGYTFELRDDVRWSDGTRFTADDVVFTFEAMERHRGQLAPTVISTPTPDTIERVRARGRHRVEFRLRRPDWTFERFTGAGGIPIMPAHVWADVREPGKARDPELLVGTGPYRLDSMDLAAGAYSYVARDDYFLGRPVVGRIEHLPVGDPLNALAAGEIDQAGGVGPGTGLRPEAIRQFEGSEEYRVIESPEGHTVTALYWNLAAGGALADVRFRRACAYAIDRAGMLDRLFGGKGAPGNPGLIPPGNRYHVDVEQYAYDPDRAEALLDQAGYTRPGPGRTRRGPDGPLRFELLSSSAQPQPPVQLVVAALARVGIEVEPASVDLATFGERRTSGRTELSINTFGGTNTDEQPDGMGKVYGSESRSLQRAQGYANDEFDRLLARQRETLDRTERTDIAHRMQRIVAEELPVLPLFYPPLTTIVRRSPFDGWFDTPGGVGGLVPAVNNKLAFVTGSGKAPR